MTSNYNKDDPIFGTLDLDDEYITDAWLVDKYVGNTLWSCGYNTKGGLGDGTIVPKSSPVQIGALVNWKQVSASPSFGTGVLGNNTAAVKTDGTLWTCGYNGYGQLGNGTNSLSVFVSTPIQVGALSNWKQVACGRFSTSAVKTDGTLWTWGYNSSGQLGDGTVVPKSSPIQFGSLTNWKYVANGIYHTAAIKTDGTLWTCGYNRSVFGGPGGELGDGTIVDKSSPVQVGSLTTWKQVACGFSFTAAIKTDGTLWTWGNNSYGNLGDGTVVPKSTPIQVGSLTNWKQVACGYFHTMAIKTDGTLWGCGYNLTGRLGIGNTTSMSSPVQIGALTNWKSVSCGYGHTTAIKTDGTLWSFGKNSYGELGYNTGGLGVSTPVQIGTLTNWKQVSAGGYHTSAITFTEIS